MIEMLLFSSARAVTRGAAAAGKSIAGRQAQSQAEAETSDWAAKALAKFGNMPEEPKPASMPSQLAKAASAPRTQMRPSTVVKPGPSRSPGFVGTNMKPARAPASFAARTALAAADPATVAATVASAAHLHSAAPAPARSRLLAANPAAYRVPVAPTSPKAPLPGTRDAHPTPAPASPPPAAAAPAAFMPPAAPLARTASPPPREPMPAASPSATAPTAAAPRQSLARPARIGAVPEPRATFGKRPARSA